MGTHRVGIGSNSRREYENRQQSDAFRDRHRMRPNGEHLVRMTVDVFTYKPWLA